MTHRTRELIESNVRKHSTELQRLRLIIHKPGDFESILADGSRHQTALVMLRSFAHALPYLLAAIVGSRALLFSLTESPLTLLGHVGYAATGLAFGLAGGMILGLAFGGTVGLAFGLVGALTAGIVNAFPLYWVTVLAFGLAMGLAFGSTVGLKSGLSTGLAAGVSHGMAFSLITGTAFIATGSWSEDLPKLLTISAVGGLLVATASAAAGGSAFGVAGGVAGALAFGFAKSGPDDPVSGLALGTVFLIGFLFTYFRVFYWPIHYSMIFPKLKPQLYPRHPLNWDDSCLLPFPHLEQLLSAFVLLEPDHEAEIDRLIADYPSQRKAALYAKVMIVARKAGAVGNLAEIDKELEHLPEGNEGPLTTTHSIKAKAAEICQLESKIQGLNQPYLIKPYRRLQLRAIDAFISQTAGYPAPIAHEFRVAAMKWHEKAQLGSTKLAILDPDSVVSVFRTGIPADQEVAFLQREKYFHELQGHILHASNCPCLIIYGRRRTGKSTFVRNLKHVLPSHIDIRYISMQSPSAFSSPNHFAGLVARQVGKAAGLEKSQARNLIELEEVLNAADAALTESDRFIILAIDEYENIDHKIGQRVFAEDVLATLRESIQEHRHLTWAFVGSHRLDELKNAPWASYLVSARTIHIKPFSAEETRTLLTQPLKTSKLWDEHDRPSFKPGFWGDTGIERIHAETGGWPHLVQLVADTAIEKLNQRNKSSVDRAILDEALETACERGDSVLSQLIEKESCLDGEFEYLRGFADAESQAPPECAEIRRSLKRRELVKESGGAWLLRAPILARWLRQQYSVKSGATPASV